MFKKIISLILIFILILLVGCCELDSINNSSDSQGNASVLSSSGTLSANSSDSQEISKNNNSTVSSTDSISDTVLHENSSESTKQISAQITEVTCEILNSPDEETFEIPSFQSKNFTDTKSGKVLPYKLFVPKNYSKSKKYPVLFFLHGAGERGNDNTIQLSNFKSSFKTAGDILKHAIIIAPQCPEYGWWNIDEQYADENGWLGAAMRLLDKVRADY